MYDYSQWPNFSKSKLIDQQTGAENPNVAEFTSLMNDVQTLRTWYGKPMYLNSCYRSPQHTIEAKKLARGGKLGMHTVAAVDFRVPVEDCHKIVKKAFEMGFTGIGINLTGSANSRFIHLDKRPTPPRIWSY